MTIATITARSATTLTILWSIPTVDMQSAEPIMQSLSDKISSYRRAPRVVYRADQRSTRQGVEITWTVTAREESEAAAAALAAICEAVPT